MKKIFILFLSLFLIINLSSCGKKEELRKENKQIEKINKKDEKSKNDKVNQKLKKFNKDIKKISFTELNNSLYSNGGGENLREKIKILSASGETIENRMKATFLQSFLGDYKNALIKRKKLCENNKNSQFCKKVELNLISYRPVDVNGNVLNNVKISVDGQDYGKLKGKNYLKVENKFVHRIKVSKEGYLGYFKKIFIDSNGMIKESLNPKLLKADKKEIIDSNKNNTISTKNFIYNIKADSFITNNGKKYSGKVKLYIFDIGEEDGDLNILNLDAFDKDGNYLGNSMVTFGMPYIKAYDLNGNELKILNPIVGKGKIQNIQKAPGIDLENVPKNKWLTSKDYKKYNIPPFWILDSENGIWLQSSMKILDNKGNYEFKLK